MEESGASGGDNWTWRWVVDPLDGTTNFLHGIPHWAISMALQRRTADGSGEVAAGMIYSPATTRCSGPRRAAAPSSTTAACASPPGAT